ncbi:hypothetical protein F750_3970 [Streptomyces sp. PAMC 26508]|nr:hypothetical protein F750_3970 [Streptomyces sp. PAMC 26508]
MKDPDATAAGLGAFRGGAERPRVRRTHAPLDAAGARGAREAGQEPSAARHRPPHQRRSRPGGRTGSPAASPAYAAGPVAEDG